MPFLFGKMKTAWEKNAQELLAAANGELSALLKGRAVPVFVFHSVQAASLEAQLLYLARNGYATVDADTLLALLRNGTVPPKTVALTFDDATGSFWAVAYPLLKKYGFRAILFVIPGLVPEGPAHPNLDDVRAGRAPRAEIDRRETMQPLCSWTELGIMHAGGSVDIQSHSLTHSRIPVSPRLVDFIHPRFDTNFYGNVGVPVAPWDDPVRPLRFPRLGAPVYDSASRLKGRRYLENPAIAEDLVRFVAGNGGETFFAGRLWRRSLLSEYRRSLKWHGASAEYETSAAMEAAIARELIASKTMLEERFKKAVCHFCFPWFQGSFHAEQLAGRCGYAAVYYFLRTAAGTAASEAEAPAAVRRIPCDYIHCLPGRGQQSPGSVLKRKTHLLSLLAGAGRRGIPPGKEHPATAFAWPNFDRR